MLGGGEAKGELFDICRLRLNVGRSFKPLQRDQFNLTTLSERGRLQFVAQ